MPLSRLGDRQVKITLHAAGKGAVNPHSRAPALERIVLDAPASSEAGASGAACSEAGASEQGQSRAVLYNSPLQC